MIEQYIYLGQIIATAGLFTWVGFYVCTTKNTKELVKNSREVSTSIETINTTMEKVSLDLHAAEIERGRMILHQDEINSLIEENKEINLKIRESLEIKEQEPKEENSASKKLDALKKPKND